MTTVIWLAVTFLTAPEPPDRLRAFYRRVRPGGAGWARAVPEAVDDHGLGRGVVQWIVGCVVVYLALFGIGDVLLGRGFRGVGALLLAVGLVWWLVSATAATESAK